MAVSLKELAAAIGAELAGDGELQIGGVNTLEDAAPGQISFLANPRYAQQLQTTKASAVIVSPSVSADNIGAAEDEGAVLCLHQSRRACCTAIASIRMPAFTAKRMSIRLQRLAKERSIYPGCFVGPRSEDRARLHSLSECRHLR